MNTPNRLCEGKAITFHNHKDCEKQNYKEVNIVAKVEQKAPIVDEIKGG